MVAAEALLAILALFGIGAFGIFAAIFAMPAPGDLVDSERLPLDW
jgi:hypothetical protein